MDYLDRNFSFIASSIDQTNQINQFYIFQNKETALLFKNDDLKI